MSGPLELIALFVEYANARDALKMAGMICEQTKDLLALLSIFPFYVRIHRKHGRCNNEKKSKSQSPIDLHMLDSKAFPLHIIKVDAIYGVVIM